MKKGPAPELGIADKVIEFDNLMKFVRYHDRVCVVFHPRHKDRDSCQRSQRFPYVLTLHGTDYRFPNTDQIVPFVKSLGYQVLYEGEEI